MSSTAETKLGTPLVLAQAAEAETAHVDETHAEEAHAAAEQGTEAHAGEEQHGLSGYELPYELPHAAMLLESMHIGPFNKLLEATAPHGEGHHAAGRPHPTPSFLVNPAFSILYVLLLVWVIRKALSQPSVRRPGFLQNMVEALLGGLRDFYVGIMGEHGYRFAPYLVSLFLFIWMNNVAVLVPGMKSPDSSFKTTLALALITFIYARYHNIKALGFKGYVHHLMGSPNDKILWIMSPLFLVLELIGEIIKPLSLALRLFGNILGEDKLLAVFLGLGMLVSWALLGHPNIWIGLPLHLPFFFLVLLLSTIQAVVFTTLAAIYIVMMMPHDDHHHEEEGHGEAKAASPVGASV